MAIFYIILFLLQVGVIVYFVRKGRKQKKINSEKAAVADDSSYEGLRNLALQVSPTQLKLSIPDADTLVYGVIMDCNIGDGIVTLSAYITGAVSLYFSSGGVKTGGGLIEEVAELAVELVTTAQKYIGRSIKVTNTDLPPAGAVRFYLLTNHGTYVAQELLTDFENSSSAWLPVFEKGNEVISQIHNTGNGSIMH